MNEERSVILVLFLRNFYFSASRDIKLFQDWGFDLLKYVVYVSMAVELFFYHAFRYDNCAGRVRPN